MVGSSSRRPAIGIDLGTTYSCVGVWRNNRIEIIQNDQGNKTTPSIVAFTDTHRLIGDGAKYQATRNYKNTVFDVKRLIGRRFGDASVQSDVKLWPFDVISGEWDKPTIVVQYKGERKEFPPEQISSFVLTKMADIAKAFLGCPIKDVVVTIPAYFDERQRQATMDAGIIADLNVMAILNEPTAAAMAYGFDKKPDSIILIFDLGGGTFDITIAEVNKGNIKVLASTGDSHLGGVDFDNNMVEYLIEEFKRKHNNADISGNPKARKKLQDACERAKRTLSVEPQANIEIDSIHEDIDFSYTISRARFEELNMHLFEKCIDKVAECLRDIKMDKSKIQDVVLVGGSTKIPKVQSMLQEFFNGKELCQGINPDEAVAYGAALHAAYLSDNKVQDTVLHDVTPLSLGTDIDGGLFDPVIPRNTTIPTKMEKVYCTATNYQSSFHIGVYQGERPDVKDNVLLRSCELKGIPLAPRGVSKMTVSFEIDTNGILTVSAVDKVNGNRIEVTIDKDQRRLNNEEIRRMVLDAERYKADDENHKKNVEAKNELENILIDLKKSTLEDGDIKPKDKKQIQSQIVPIEQWLNNDVKLVDGVKFRREYDEHVSRLQKAVQIVNSSSESSSFARHANKLSIALSIFQILGTAVRIFSS